jgi:hypothetical protein
MVNVLRVDLEVLRVWKVQEANDAGDPEGGHLRLVLAIRVTNVTVVKAECLKRKEQRRFNFYILINSAKM